MRKSILILLCIFLHSKAGEMALNLPEYFQKGAEESGEPVSFDFKRKCGPSGDRKEAYDPKTQTYFLHIHDIARFEVKAVAANLEKRRVVLEITGMRDKPEGPLTLIIPAKDGKKNSEYRLFHEGFDKERFRIERKNGVTTVEFLPKGRELLKAGVWFQYIDFFRN
jgi:hypothetical protein